ncbi:IS30 family transposase [Enterococcus plantarum]|uniref:IS30 family transposase n=1 Tax=Enterococcus plantarum TaxID=1077675 RepID=A0A2W3ZHW9_9ENTE|nr:IS30 family transposase [Enterococcus plantarum]PZL73664.1 IS30 family transposase [Enterococcus plantarum]
MTSYTHLTIREREMIFLYHGFGFTIRRIGRLIKRSPSTVMRELKRNTTKFRTYSPSLAQKSYHKNKQKCGRKRILDQSPYKEIIRKLLFEEQWSPEQIANRINLENNESIVSYPTIYRSIYDGLFDEGFSASSPGARKMLRRKGRKSVNKRIGDRRGRFTDVKTIHERPTKAETREELGHWEADTVLGHRGKSCLVTLVDRKSRFLLAGRIAKNDSICVRDMIVKLLSPLNKKQRKTITPDRGPEFAKYKYFSRVCGVDCYFADPWSPWQRGTNENTNGLIREYLPKRTDMAPVSEKYIESMIIKLNNRPRKCLDWQTPYEIFYEISSTLID